MTCALACAVAGCTDDELARLDVHNGIGVAAPSPVIIDGTVPGNLKSRIRVDDATIAPLRTRLEQILDLGGRGGHVALVLNPAPGTVPAGCTPGKGRVCLRAVHQVNVPHEDSILVLPGLPLLTYDPARMVLPGVQGSFAVAQAEFVGIDLTKTIPSGAPDQSSDLFTLTRLLPAENSELRLRLHPEKLEFAGHGGDVGLWLPATLVAASASTVSSHVCDAITSQATLGAVCGEILQQMDEGIKKAAGIDWLYLACHRVEFSLDFRRIRLWLGLVPETTPGCNPLAHRWDLEWMRNAPNPREYRQGCLKVRGGLHASVNAEPMSGAPQPGPDILFSVEIGKCSSVVQAACATVLDCDGKAREIAEKQLEKMIPARVTPTLEQELGPIFNYTAGAGSPYQVPPSSPCAGLGDPNCIQQLRQHHLPASLTRLAYGWFGNAFGSFDTTPSYQFPVTEVSGRCPTFFTYVKGKDEDRCINCPGTNCAPNHEAGTCLTAGGLPCETNSYPAQALEFWYALDPDGDGHRENQDNCPLLANSSQADKDGDGLGDACDPCPCTPGPDVDGDGVCTVACNGPGDNCPTVANPHQENCNLDAEVAREAEVLGDACDPVPCPRFTPVFAKPALGGEIKSPLYVNVKVTQTLDRIDVTPIGSRAKDAQVLTEVPVSVPATAYRYCIHNLGQLANCFNNAAIDDAWLGKASTAADEDTSTLWHRVTIQGLGLGIAEGPRTYQVGADFWRRWTYATDFDAWKKSSWGAPWVPDLAAAAASTFFTFEGRFWMHAATGVGTTDTSKNTGLHALKNAPNQPADSQSNHYQPLAPYAKHAFYQAIGVPELLVVDRECHWCAQALQIGDECPHCKLEALSELSSPVSRVVVKNGDGRVGVISTSGALSPLRSNIAATLAAKLGSPILWIDQAEPSAYLGKGLVSPASVGLSPADGALVEQVYSAGGQLLGQADLVRDPGDDVPGLSIATAAPAAQSPGRSGFVPVYSRSLARVFLVGGSGASGRDVAFRPSKQTASGGTSRRERSRSAPPSQRPSTMATGSSGSWTRSRDHSALAARAS